MKSLLLAITILSSFSAMAYETKTATSYSGGCNWSHSCISGETRLSGTSAVRFKEQVEVNQNAVASFLQSGELEATSAEVKEIAALAKKALHEEIEAMSDRDAISSVIEK